MRNLDRKMMRMTVLGCEARKCPNKLAGCFVRLPTPERLPALGLPTRCMLGHEDRNYSIGLAECLIGKMGFHPAPTPFPPLRSNWKAFLDRDCSYSDCALRLDWAYNCESTNTIKAYDSTWVYSRADKYHQVRVSRFATCNIILAFRDPVSLPCQPQRLLSDG